MNPIRPFLALACLALWGCTGPSTTSHGPVGDFSLVERSGRIVTQADFSGKVWVASFVFTRCGGPCPKITAAMARLQSDLAGEKDVVLVTFTVDPTHDTPQILYRYAESYRADPDRWLFLTGKEDKVHELIGTKFHLSAQPTVGTARTPGNEVTHSTRLALVDRQGRIRAYFDGAQADDLPKLRQQIKELLREKP